MRERLRPLSPALRCQRRTYLLVQPLNLFTIRLLTPRGGWHPLRSFSTKSLSCLLLRTTFFLSLFLPRKGPHPSVFFFHKTILCWPVRPFSRNSSVVWALRRTPAFSGLATYSLVHKEDKEQDRRVARVGPYRGELHVTACVAAVSPVPAKRTFPLPSIAHLSLSLSLSSPFLSAINAP